MFTNYIVNNNKKKIELRIKKVTNMKIPVNSVQINKGIKMKKKRIKELQIN